MIAVLDPASNTERFQGLIEQAQRGVRDRSAVVSRFLSAADRRGHGWTDAETVEFGAALSSHAVRDALWLAVDDHRIDTRDLFQHLARHLPEAYRPAPLFLFAWHAWREGNGALASVAAQRALDVDPNYSAALLMLAALDQGIDPRQMPALAL